MDKLWVGNGGGLEGRPVQENQPHIESCNLDKKWLKTVGNNIKSVHDIYWHSCMNDFCIMTMPVFLDVYIAAYCVA